MRYWEIDFARGIAVILMVLFNWSFALEFLNVYSIDAGWIYWWLFPRIIASMFIFIAGLSFSISYAKNKHPKKHVQRGLKIFGIGMLATLVTYTLFPKYIIIFGILHLIGLSIILGPYLAKLKKYVVVLGVILAAVGIIVSGLAIASPWLLPLGIPPSNFTTFDYFPILPWLGVFMVGLYFGMTAYGNEGRRFKSIGQHAAAKPLSYIGRHSLIIYIIHQPALIAILIAAGYHIL